MTALFTQPGAAVAPAPNRGPYVPNPFVGEHPPTPEQWAILQAASTGEDLVIEAGAGTGKTSTLKMIASTSPRRGLYLAYNKAIADDARASFPSSVDCRTAHSLAFAVVGRDFQHRLNGPRIPAREVARILGIPAVLDLGAHALTGVKVARIVMDSVARFCHSNHDHPEYSDIPQIPGLDIDPLAMSELRGQVLPMVNRAWADLSSVNGQLKFTHDVYLKLWALGRPTLHADLIFLDEAQDANPVIAEIVDYQPAQKILVGDQSQAIYGWRGAVDAMGAFIGQRFQLSQSFRFGQRIADEANEWLDLLDAPLRLTGNPARDSRVERVPAPSAILCRTNAGAIGQAMAAIGARLRPALVGGGDDVRRLAEACRDLRTGRGTFHPELMAFASWAEVQDYVEHDAGGQDLKALVKLVDSHGPEAIIRIVDQLVDEHNADVVISTAHRAKGREWESVRLAADWNPPYDKEGNLIASEAMLAYVAVTRAKQALDPSALPGSKPLPETPWDLASIVGTLQDAAARDAADTHRGNDPMGAPTTHKGLKETCPAPECADGEQCCGGGPRGDCPCMHSADELDTLVQDPEPIGTDLSPKMVGWLNMAKEAKGNKERWAEVEAQAVQKLKDHLGDRDSATVNGRPAISYKESKPGTQLNTKALEKDHPTIYETYLVEKKAARPFKILGGDQ